MKKISVLIAAYNANDFIIDCIKSILDQRIPKNYTFELIVGIDGCEKTWETILDFKNNFLKYFRMDDNYGTYITFNTLVNFANGNLIARFDADDIMLENYLLEQINIFENDESVDLTRTWSIYTDINKVPIMIQLQDKTFTSVDGERKRGTDGQFIMRKQVWNKLGAFKPWRCFADTDFLIRAQISGFKLFEVEKFLYLRRVHENSLTQRKETGYNSEIRKSHKDSLKRDSSYYRESGDVYVKPVVGSVEIILP